LKKSAPGKNKNRKRKNSESEETSEKKKEQESKKRSNKKRKSTDKKSDVDKIADMEENRKKQDVADQLTIELLKLTKSDVKKCKDLNVSLDYVKLVKKTLSLIADDIISLHTPGSMISDRVIKIVIDKMKRVSQWTGFEDPLILNQDRTNLQVDVMFGELHWVCVFKKEDKVYLIDSMNDTKTNKVYIRKLAFKYQVAEFFQIQVELQTTNSCAERALAYAHFVASSPATEPIESLVKQICKLSFKKNPLREWLNRVTTGDYYPPPCNSENIQPKITKRKVTIPNENTFRNHPFIEPTKEQTSKLNVIVLD